MMRIASVIGLPSENITAYEQLHANVWPDVLARLRLSNMTNYSIFRYGEVLFSYLEYTGDDLASDSAQIAADPVTREWWAVCNPLQAPLGDRASDEWWLVIPEIFHLD